jgi:hypothetical protein
MTRPNDYAKPDAEGSGVAPDRIEWNGENEMRNF